MLPHGRSSNLEAQRAKGFYCQRHDRGLPQRVHRTSTSTIDRRIISSRLHQHRRWSPTRHPCPRLLGQPVPTSIFRCKGIQPPELKVWTNPSSTAKKCSATEDCCRNPGGDRRPSSTVKYCSATGFLPNRQRGERPGVNGLPFSHRRKETPVFNNLAMQRRAAFSWAVN